LGSQLLTYVVLHFRTVKSWATSTALMREPTTPWQSGFMLPLAGVLFRDGTRRGYGGWVYQMEKISGPARDWIMLTSVRARFINKKTWRGAIH